MVHTARTSDSSSSLVAKATTDADFAINQDKNATAWKPDHSWLPFTVLVVVPELRIVALSTMDNASSLLWCRSLELCFVRARRER